MFQTISGNFDNSDESGGLWAFILPEAPLCEFLSRHYRFILDLLSSFLYVHNTSLARRSKSPCEMITIIAQNRILVSYTSRRFTLEFHGLSVVAFLY